MVKVRLLLFIEQDKIHPLPHESLILFIFSIIE